MLQCWLSKPQQQQQQQQAGLNKLLKPRQQQQQQTATQVGCRLWLLHASCRCNSMRPFINHLHSSMVQHARQSMPCFCFSVINLA